MHGESIDLDESIQVSIDKKTVWIHSPNDGSTVGRFSKYLAWMFTQPFLSNSMVQVSAYAAPTNHLL